MLLRCLALLAVTGCSSAQGQVFVHPIIVETSRSAGSPVQVLVAGKTMSERPTGVPRLEPRTVLEVVSRDHADFHATVQSDVDATFHVRLPRRSGVYEFRRASCAGWRGVVDTDTCSGPIDLNLVLPSECSTGR